MKTKFYNLIAMLLVTSVAFAQTARLQAIHNAADPAAASVDVWVNGALLPDFDDFAFRSATPFIDVPAGVPLSIAVAPDTSTTAASAIATFNVGPLMMNETYVLFANGVVAPGFDANPDGLNIDFNLYPYAPARESATNAGDVDLLVFHGATDAPTVDVNARTGGGAPINLIDNIAYSNFQGYASVPPAEYALDVLDSSNSTVIATFIADVSGLAGGSAVVFASGFLNDSQGPAFGIWVTLADGSTFGLPTPGNARLQVIHNSPDPLAQTVDVYVNGWQASSALNDLAFRGATEFFDVQTGYETFVAINGPASTDADDQNVGTVSFGNALVDGQTYIVFADGLLDTTIASNPDGISTSFTLVAVGGAAETGTNPSNVDLLIHHGSPDAPYVDVEVRNVGTIVDNVPYQGTTPSYISVPASTYIIDITDSTGNTTVKSYYAPISTAAGAAATVFASGFLNPSNGAPFGLWVALATGTTFPLTEIGTARAQVIHNSADAAATVVDVYIQDGIGDVIARVDSVPFRTATSFVDLPSNVDLTVGFAVTPSTDISDTVVSIPVGRLDSDSSYIVIANGILSGSGYSPSPSFGLDVFVGAREQAANQGMNMTDVLVYHGSTDAPTVDVDETSVPAGNLVDDISYGEFQGYLELGTADYTIAIKDMTGSTTVATYQAPLSTLGLADAALTVLASGFFDPGQNSSGPGFGLYAALPSGGALVPLPLVTGIRNVETVIENVTIYPNPTTDFVQIDYSVENRSDVRLAVFNSMGQEVKSILFMDSEVGVNRIQADLSDLVSGFYMVNLSVNGEAQATERVFVK